MVGGYNMHLPGIAAAKELKRVERAAMWARRDAIKQGLIAYRERYGDEAFIRARLSGELRAPDPTVRRATRAW